jgi:hypothetical protein
MRPHPILATTRPRRIAVFATVLVILAALLPLGVTALIRMSSDPATKPPNSSQPSPVSKDAGAHDAQVPPEQAAAVADEVTRLRNTAPVAPHPPSNRNHIAGEADQQPDLYAAAFVKELLTQNYATPRDDLLRWVQAESALTTEPKVVGLIPTEQRPKWAAFSVSEGSTPPVPSTADWTSLGLRRGHTTVKIQRVIEPVPWSTAVAAGEISDAGVTAREVTALVTLHTTEAGIDHEFVTSVALTLNLEGPPTLANWGFVGAVTYDAVPVSRS